MIIDKNQQQQQLTHQQLQQLNQQQAVQQDHDQSQFNRSRHRHRSIAAENCTAAATTIIQGANEFREAGQEEEEEEELEENYEDEGDNDEENIVIDMQDEDDEDDDCDGLVQNNGGHQLNSPGDNYNYHHANGNLAGTADYESGHFVSSYTSNNNNNLEANKSNVVSDAYKTNCFKHEIQFESESNNQIDCDGQCDSVFKFNIGDLVWFDPNQLGFSIPGKVIDFYPDLKVLTIEGYAQTIGDLSGDFERHNRLLLEADQELQVYNLSDSQQFKTIKMRKPLIDEKGAEDLVDLEELSIESIIWNLKLRYKQELVYTNCGKKILISVNPYKQLSDIYNLDQVNKYDSLDANKLRSLTRFCPSITNKSDNCSPDDHLHHLRQQNQFSASNLLRWLLLQNDNNGNQQRKSANNTNITDCSSINHKEPHIFQLANEALKKLLINGQDQCIVLLGESGSGKTEACKLLIQYLATVNKSPTNLMTEQILESIQVLESFGNAKTIYNDNSSRFGKLLNIRFNLFNGFIIDAKTIDLNLLDKTRIVSQSENERNYHIFYELLSGLSKNEKEKYGLQTAEKYFYLNQGHCVDLPGKEDGDNFRSLLASMQVLGFNYEEQDTIFRILASVLHLGNIYFHRKVLAVRSGKLAQQQQQQQAQQNQTQSGVGNVSGVEGVEIGSDTEVRWVSHLLQIQFDSVMRCMTVRTTESTTSVNPGNNYSLGGAEIPPQVVVDRIVTPLNIDQALDTRDAIARALYNCLFKWLVQRINVMINGNDSLLNENHHQQQQLLSRHQMSNNRKQQNVEPIYLCRTSESLCEFQPNKLNQPDHSHQSSLSRGQTTKQSSTATSYKSQQVQNSSLDQQQLQRLTSATISILDAFGFENLSENNFEQLCINYTAELLNYHTNRYLIRLEQAEYIKERLRWTPISILNNCSLSQTTNSGSLLSTSATATTTTSSYSSNSANSIINLISKKPLGILALLDDECNFPKATDQSFVEKCHHNHTLNENYQGARLAANCQEFGIRHFKQSSRLVWYQVDGFVEKNRDNLRHDIVDLLLGSKMTIVADMLRKIHQTNCDNYGSNNKTLSRTYDGRYVSMKPRTTTVAARFQDTLHNNLVLESINYTASSTMNTQLPTEVSHYQTTTTTATNIKESITGEIYANSNYTTTTTTAGSCLNDSCRPNPWFVICFKPNRSQSAQVFDVAYVQEQFKCFNLLEISQMRKIGYPIRLRYGEFVRRYKCLVPQKFLNNLTSCQDIRMANNHQKYAKMNNKKLEEGYRKQQQQKKGSEKMNNDNYSNKFEIKRAIRDVCSAIVEYRFIERHQESLVKDQYQCGLTKMFLNENLYCRLEEMRLNEHKKAIEILQKSIRMWLVRREYLIKRRAAIVIQANMRAFLVRRDFWRKYLLIINLQRTWRRQLIIKRRKMLEAKRLAQRKYQQYLLQEVQAQQLKQANQFRFRQLHANKSVGSKSSQGSQYAPKVGLDIPEELAQLYRLQKNWLPIHDLSHVNELNLIELIDREKKRCQRHGASPLSVPFIVLNSSLSENNDSKMIKYIQELELDDKYSLQNFLIKYYTIEVPQFGYSRSPITRAFNWPQLARKRHVAIRTRVDDEQKIRERFEIVEQKAIAIYKLILRYIDSDLDSNNSQDKQHSKQQNGSESIQKLVKFKLIADYVIYLCLDEELLRDELYLQLASQSWQNPKLKSMENVWKLMANCLGCFGPNDIELTKFLLRYASDYCCDKYRSIALEKLSYVLMQQNDGRSQVRRYPLTMIEYLANEQAIGRLAIASSCYMDDYALNGPIQGDFETNIEDISATNHSNKTIVRIRPQTTAEQLASEILRTRNLPEKNLTGWSVEVQHEAAQSDFSSRLRGDDYLLDHLARVELLPKFVQLIEFGSEEFRAQVSSGANNESLGVQLHIESDNYSGYGRQVDSRVRKHSLNEFTAPPSLAVSQPSDPEQLMNNRHSVISQRSYETNFNGCNKGGRRISSASSDIEYSMAGKLSQTSKLNRRYIQTDSLQDEAMPYHLGMPYDRYGGYPSMPESSNLNRRSMSMQELQLASSALNGRYFQQYPQQQQQQQHQMPSSNHYASSYVSSQAGRGGGAGSLQQLAGVASNKQSHKQFNQPLRGRSQTPNSMMFGNGTLNRMSSSAYGSETYASSRITPNSGGPTYAGAGSDVTGEGVGMIRQSRAESSLNRLNRAARTRRSASSSSRVPATGGRNLHSTHSNAPGSDYASAHSDYERSGVGYAGGRYAAPNQQPTNNNPQRPSSSQSSSSSRNQMRQHPASLAASARPKNPLVERIVNKLPNSNQAKNMRYQAHGSGIAMQNQHASSNFEQHYATSSAMSDTSEAPSLASHVRGVKVPQNNGDLDQYLDDLFNPMLDEVELDELSDARSLATSIRGTILNCNESSGADNLDDLCDAKTLSKIIRGSDIEEQATDPEAGTSKNEEDKRDATGALSPTFELLLESLKENNENPGRLMATTDHQSISSNDDANQERGILMSQLSGMNLSELKALNQKLEDKIQVAQMNRASYSTSEAVSSNNENIPPPPPPPQPSFGDPSFDDIYSRAKTIRIGKWRWPPVKGQTSSSPVEDSSQAQQATIESYFKLKEQKRLSQISATSSSSSNTTKQGVSAETIELKGAEVSGVASSGRDLDEMTTKTSNSNNQQQQTESASIAPPNVGKLKISSEMKAKLEQLTTSSGTTQQQQPQTGSHSQSGIVSQVTKSLLSSSDVTAHSGTTDEVGEGKRVKRLTNHRKDLLENQLLGANNNNNNNNNNSSNGVHSEQTNNSNRVSTESNGSKVLAAKQQLAAAAGVALAALGSNSVNQERQASSRRQSGQLVGDALQQHSFGGIKQEQQVKSSRSGERNSRAMQDELGPQSQAAISQRQVFYQISASSDQLNNLPEPSGTAIKSEHGGSEVQLRESEEGATCSTQACAISSDNLQLNKSGNSLLSGRAAKVAVKLPPASNLTRAIQISSHLNEAGQSSELGKECDRIYGRSVAKSLSQRQHESLANKLKSSPTGTSVLGGDSQWVSSSPDVTLESNARRLATAAASAKKRENSAKRANTDSDHYQQVSSKRRVVATAATAAATKKSLVKQHQQQGIPNKVSKRQLDYEQPHESTINPPRCLSYANVDWQVKIRKEFFMPSETYDDPLVVQLIFAQLVADVFNPRHWTRLNNKERAAIKSLMKDNSIGYAPSLPQIGQMQSVKRDLVRLARSFGLYFTRSYPAQNYASIATTTATGEDQASEGLVGGTKRQRNNRHHRRSSVTQNDSCESSSSSSSSSPSSSCCSSSPKSIGLSKTGQANKLMKRLSRTNNLGLEWIDMVAVHHSGLRLVSVVSNGNNNNTGEQLEKHTLPSPTCQAAMAASSSSSGPPFGYRVLETLKYRDMTDVSQVGQFELLVSMRNGKKCWLLSSEQSSQLVSLLKCFHADYNDHLNSGQQAQESDNLARKNNNIHNSSQTTTKSTNNNKDALLAFDDDHHGDHFAQRQIADGFSELRKATNSDNDLVDNKRVLSNNLANNNTKIKQQQQQYNEQHKQHSSSGNCNNGHRNVKSSSNNSNNLSSGASQSNIESPTSPTISCDRAIIEPIEQHKPSSGISLESVQQQQQQQYELEQRKSQNQNQIVKNQKQQDQQVVKQSSSKGSYKKNSLWQNSLSRMSNKFSIFSGSQSRATNGNNNSNYNSSSSTEKRSINLAADDSSTSAEPNNNITTTSGSHSSRSAQVALDAWIETKVDFDEDDEEGRNNISPPVAPTNSNIATEPTDLTGDQQQRQQQSLVSKSSIESSSSSSAANKKQSSIESKQQQKTVNTTDSGKAEADGKYSLLQFALYNFREAIDKYSLESCASKVRVPGDTSTLRGSLKLIETLRNAKSTGHGNALNIASTSGSNGINIIGKESRKSSRLLPGGNNSSGSNDWTWRELAEMVKYTKVPIKHSLLKLQNDDLNKRAVDCFLAIMQYMGDATIPATGNPASSSSSAAASKQHYTQSSSQDEVECVYLILMNCHNFPILRDEIYCQLMKQTTNNKSTNPDSCLMGWRLFSIVAAYFDCSEAFKPYLLKYLETAAYDKRRAYCSVASLCLQNLRKTFKYGGRKNVPSIEEIAATSAGRNSKRQIYRLPGGTERVINTKSTTVVEDIIHEICSNMLNVTDQDEMLEFSLYCIADGDLYTMPLNRDEYILDITTELIKNHQQYFLIFCRSIWYYPLRLDSKLYIEVIFNQIAPDYLEGLLLVLPNLKTINRHHQDHTTNSKLKQFRLKNKLVKEIARIAALLHRASGTDYMPHKDEVKYLLPKPIITAIKQYQKSLNNNNHQSLAKVNDQSNSSSAASSSGSQLGRNVGSLEQSVGLDKQQIQNIDNTIISEDHDNHYEASNETIITTPQKWIELVQANWREMSAFDTLDAKAQFLDIVRHWPLFGSSFFAIKFIQRDLIQPLDFILALNKLGIQMLDRTTHETIHKYPFNEVISTRKVRSEDGALFLDLKCGNLMKRTIIRIQTDQAHEISRLIRQYIDIELLQQKQLNNNNNSHQQLKPTTLINSTDLQPPDLTASNRFINHDQPSMVNRGSESESGQVT